MTKSIPILDLLFLLTETRESPKHVSTLLQFKRPENAGKNFVADLVAGYRRAKPIPPFNYLPDFSITRMPRWIEVDKIDMTYHVQHVVLPPRTTNASLLEAVAVIHGQMLERGRPCFRVYVIDGLADGDFAIYLKIHHAIVDGHSAIARISGSLDENPAARAVRPFYTIKFDAGNETGKSIPGPARAQVLQAMKKIALTQSVAFKDLYMGLIRKAMSRDSQRSGAGSVPFTAPRSLLNQATHPGRSLATLTLPIGEMKSVGKAFGGTLNDVAVTVVDAGVTRYLKALGQAPKAPLVAMCPVSLREAGDKEAATKASAAFVPLGMPAATIGQRMDQVMKAAQSAKAELRGMSKDAAMIYAILALGLSEAADAIGADAVARPLANFVLSNVPGARTDLYLRGAKMQSIYPISALPGGIGLNVTLLSYATSMDFGFVGNASALPGLDKLARFTQEAFAALAKEGAKRHQAVDPGSNKDADKPKKQRKPALRADAKKVKTTIGRKKPVAKKLTQEAKTTRSKSKRR